MQEMKDHGKRGLIFAVIAIICVIIIGKPWLEEQKLKKQQEDFQKLMEQCEQIDADAEKYVLENILPMLYIKEGEDPQKHAAKYLKLWAPDPPEEVARLIEDNVPEESYEYTRMVDRTYTKEISEYNEWQAQLEFTNKTDPNKKLYYSVLMIYLYDQWYIKATDMSDSLEKLQNFYVETGET